MRKKNIYTKQKPGEFSQKKAGRIPALSPISVHDYLREIGKKWKGLGYAMELGSWFGATAVPLLEGLVAAEYTLPFYSWDRWKANDEQVTRAAEFGVKIVKNQDLKPLFEENVNKVYDQIVSIKGDIVKNLKWTQGPIEICIFDAPKLPEVFGPCIERLTPHFIPGVTIFGLLDYYFWERHHKGGADKTHKLRVPDRFINYHRESFTLLKHWRNKCSCAFFRYEGGAVWEDMDKWLM